MSEERATRSWQADAIALGWPEHTIASFADAVARQQGEVLLVTELALALRTERGALQVTIRRDEPRVIALANAATRDIPSYVPPPDPFCPARDCELRVPCPVHQRQAAGGGR